MKRITIYLIFLIVIMAVDTTHAEILSVCEDEQYAYTKAVQHISYHTGLTEEQIREFCWESEYYAEDVNAWYITFYYTPLSCYRIITEIKQGKCLYCTCSWYNEEAYKTDKMYKKEVWPTVLEAMKWEEVLGPHELWDTETNAKFYEQYGYIPYMSGLGYSLGAHPHYDSAIDEQINEQEAIDYAIAALKLKYPAAEEKMKELSIGSQFCNLTPDRSRYGISFYIFREEKWWKYYMVYILSDDGECVYAEQYYEREEAT